MDLQALKIELTTDPLTRGYAAMSDADASARLNLRDRPANGTIAGLMNYLLVNKSKTGTGSDTVNTSMLGRLVVLANAAIGSDPFGATLPVTLDWKCSAMALMELVRCSHVELLAYHTAALQAILNDVKNAGVMKTADVTAIIALSNNLGSRGDELGLGHVDPSSVANAKKLP